MKVLSFFSQQILPPRKPLADALPQGQNGAGTVVEAQRAAVPAAPAETPGPQSAGAPSGPVPVEPAPRSPLQELAQSFRVRAISPRDMTDLSFDLHVAGFLTYEEYSLLAFQPELHPDFDKTTGALTGERANPDRPRDYVAEWEERLTFEREHNAEDRDSIARVERILGVLQAIDSPTNIVV